ncbi:hypothetical protein J6590_077665 [Homalodisca vitripennis]|nr:hypothetical protein J6590_077665 [Homalodisca vitripennis]
MCINRAHPLGGDKTFNNKYITFQTIRTYLHCVDSEGHDKGTGFVVLQDFPMEVLKQRACLAVARQVFTRLSRHGVGLAQSSDSRVIDAGTTYADVTANPGNQTSSAKNAISQLLEV